jgi:hypothetical protein
MVRDYLAELNAAPLSDGDGLDSYINAKNCYSSTPDQRILKALLPI